MKNNFLILCGNMCVTCIHNVSTRLCFTVYKPSVCNHFLLFANVIYGLVCIMYEYENINDSFFFSLSLSVSISHTFASR